MSSRVSRTASSALELRMLGKPSAAMDMLKLQLEDIKEFFEKFEIALDWRHHNRIPTKSLQEVYDDAISAMTFVYPTGKPHEILTSLGAVFQVTLQVASGEKIHDMLDVLRLSMKFYDRLTEILINKELNPQ